ncbi:hypothetical protein DMENIID0001_127370 [Sergentomyia squamirostris]
MLHVCIGAPIQFPDDNQYQQRSLDTADQLRVHSYHNVNDLFGFNRHPKRRRKPHKKNPCLPLAYNRNYDYQEREPIQNVNSKFLGVNFFLTDVNFGGAQYNPLGGYPCSPGLFGEDGGHQSHRPPKPQKPVNPIKPIIEPEKPVVEDLDEVIENDSPSDNPVGTPSRPGGGPLGFFGEGGLFDLSNFGGLNRPGSLFNTLSNLNSRPALTGGNVLGDSVGNLAKPIIEINVPDTINSLRTGNWNARKIFEDVLDSFGSLTSLIFGNGGGNGGNERRYK